MAKNHATESIHLEPDLMKELSSFEGIIDEKELEEMLLAQDQKLKEENKQLVKESEGELEAKRWWNRLHVARFILQKMLKAETITEGTTFNRVTGILDVMHEDLKDQDRSANPPQEDSKESIRPGYNTPYVMVCLDVLDEILKDNPSLGLTGQTPILEFINFINSEISQLKEVLIKESEKISEKPE
jgi:hypothetical protein